MGLKLILGSLMSGLLPLASSSPIPGKVVTNYDEFKDQTTITVIGEQGKAQPILYGWSQFNGRKQKPSQTIDVGFLVKEGCPHPNFIADGKRVQPDPSGANLPGFSQEEFSTKAGVRQHLFVFNFYQLPQLNQIALAKSVKYQICNQASTLSPQDLAQLRQFSARFK